MLENTATFDVYVTGHGITITDQIMTFQALKIRNKVHKNEEVNKYKGEPICWGDFVRIKHILKDEKSRQEFMVCETNVNGFSPSLYMSSRDLSSDNPEKDQICSIFQIVPQE